MNLANLSKIIALVVLVLAIVLMVVGKLAIWPGALICALAVAILL